MSEAREHRLRLGTIYNLSRLLRLGLLCTIAMGLPYAAPINASERECVESSIAIAPLEI